MKTKWGVIGSSGIAKRRTIPEGIVPADNAELTAVYTPVTQENLEVAELFGVQACATEEELIDSDCDVVYIASPNDKHYDQVIRCAEAGKHILCEKPLGITAIEAERMVQACRDNGVKLGSGFMMRFHAWHQEALKLIQEGRIGTPVLGRAQLSCWYPPIEGAFRQDPVLGGGGSLIDMGSHCIDILELFFGKARKVSCFTANRVHDYRSEDTALVILEFDNGAQGMVDSLFNVPDLSSKNRLEVYGSKGSILAEGTIGQGDAGEMIAYFSETDENYDSQQTRMENGFTIITPIPVNTYRAEIEAFSKSVLNDTPPPIDGEAGLWSQIVVEACYRSAKTGEAVIL